MMLRELTTRAYMMDQGRAEGETRCGGEESWRVTLVELTKKDGSNVMRCGQGRKPELILRGWTRVDQLAKRNREEDRLLQRVGAQSRQAFDEPQRAISDCCQLPTSGEMQEEETRSGYLERRAAEGASSRELSRRSWDCGRQG